MAFSSNVYCTKVSAYFQRCETVRKPYYVSHILWKKPNVLKYGIPMYILNLKSGIGLGV